MQILNMAKQYPDKAAVIMAGSLEQLTYGEMVGRACRLADYLTKLGFKRGDRLAVMMENNPRFFEVYWAAMISGLYYTPVNRYLSADEAAYIVNDCGANIFISSKALAEVAEEMLPLLPDCEHYLMTDGVTTGYLPYEDELSECNREHPEHPLRGAVLLYSSGTTGRPKGILRPLPKLGEKPVTANMLAPFGIGADTIYLSPAPMYHSAPIGFAMGAQAVGATVVVMETFSPQEALAAIERYGITHSQWVPTMFSRMLKLPVSERGKYDLASHKMAIHGAAPCPPTVKQGMIDWWGPMLLEYYSGSEGNGMTLINSEDWLSHPGSVGRSMMGKVHICDDEGNELPVGEDGLIYFEQRKRNYTYLNDEEKTRSSAHPSHPTWTALGDIGHVDAEGFVYLTDRKSELIISGGVNIYPAETEHLLISHEKVADVAVIGVPDEEFGESVKAIVQLAIGVEAEATVSEELIAFCKEHLAHYKCPRTVDFLEELPRLPTGKLYKRLLRDKYWGERKSKIV